jgi:predicted amidohydrolase YtcJ
MRNTLFLIGILFLLSSCFKGEHADLIVHNAKIHSFNLYNDVFEAMAIKDGQIIELGSERAILNKYRGNAINAQKREIYPGLHDAHGHLFLWAEKKMTCDLTGCRSMNEVIQRLQQFDANHNPKVLIGKGWDQSLWENKELPTNEKINTEFPDKPVVLYRIDEHALLVNTKALSKAKITTSYSISGGSVLKDENGLTGILVDNAMNPVLAILPKPNKSELKKALLACQNELLQYGITSVHEAGITLEQLNVLEELEESKKLKINIYAMLIPGEKEIEFAQKNGIYKSAHIHVRSFKVVADGALGSRGACLLTPYHDAQHSHGQLLLDISRFKEIATIALETGYQLNVHCIGDSTNRTVLKIMREVLNGKKDHRWRIEHAQVVHPSDLELFKEIGIIPSVQPTHAVSDMRFVQKRLGNEREKWAYAYKSLLNANGIIALGTDFPVENCDPFLTIEAAVNRKNSHDEPKNGYLMEEALTFDECIKGMTLWAAIASFQEDHEGSMEPYKNATFTILHNPILSSGSYSGNYAHLVYNNGKMVYQFD